MVRSFAPYRIHWCEIITDTFASFFLAPHEALQTFIEERLQKEDEKLGLDDVVQIEQHFGLSRQATLVRLEGEGYLTSAEANTMKIHIIAHARKLGFDTARVPGDKQYATYGRYVALVDTLKESGLISSSKYKQLLLDAFREDIVYDADPGEERYD